MSDSTQHTQGMLLLAGRTVYQLTDSGVNRFSASVQDAHTPEKELEDVARRLWACWNACDGMSTKFIEYLASLPHNGLASYEHIQTENATLRAEVERLRGALTGVLSSNPEGLSSNPEGLSSNPEGLSSNPRAALKGGAS
jgi:hypothetical protein